jgi:hypothetical protein
MSHTPPFLAWTDKDVSAWRKEQKVQRSYQGDVVSKIKELNDRFTITEYGVLAYEKNYPLYLIQSKEFNSSKPNVLITGGVHGYETSGPHGALEFMATLASTYEKNFNFICAPCVSPWGYETINRWNPNAIDPNRNFFQQSPAEECALLYKAVHDLGLKFHAHFDLHETTDTDESVFRPALASRDGKDQDDGGIPDGFYLVTDTGRIEKEFQEAIIQEVEKVTHIAPADEHGKIIGKEIISKGLIAYDVKKLNLCAGLTNAKFVTTTEVYPDSPKTNPKECRQAQVNALIGGLNFLNSVSNL